MTTKWNKNRKVQRKPPVCKKPPPDSPTEPPPWITWFPSGELTWLDDVFSDELETASTFTMRPAGLPDSYTATVDAPPFTIDIFLAGDPTKRKQAVTITVNRNGVPVNIRSLFNITPRSVQPYDSGLLLFGNSPLPENVTLRMMV